MSDLVLVNRAPPATAQLCRVRSGMTWANTCPVPFPFQVQSGMTPATHIYMHLKPAKAMPLQGYPPPVRILRMLLHLPPLLLPSETVSKYPLGGRDLEWAALQ